MKIRNILLYFCFIGVLFCGVLADDTLDEEGHVDSEDVNSNLKVEREPGVASDTPAQQEEEAAKQQVMGPSPNVTVSWTFIVPAGVGQGRSLDLPAGRPSKVGVLLQNVGDKIIHVDAGIGAFRYPMDMSYIIQNLTIARYFGQELEPGREASFVYAFHADNQLAGRSFGLTVQVAYRDAEGKNFLHTAINQTVALYEPDEGFDGEAFFLYLFMFGAALFMIAASVHIFRKPRKTRSVPQPQQETGTANGIPAGDVDMQWIPKEHLDMIKRNQSPPKARQRKGKASSGGESD